jgi:hypothetical protein
MKVNLVINNTKLTIIYENYKTPANQREFDDDYPIGKPKRLKWFLLIRV